MHYDCTKEKTMYRIESEGRKVTSRRDPPGQKCVYIPPGDPERETYRLSTFYHYPKSSPIDPREFAAQGLYYTGYRDRVKCFSCGQCSDNWLLGDDVTSPDWHELNCDFINGRDTTNIPLLAFLRQCRLRSNSHEPSSNNGDSRTLLNHEQSSSVRLTAGEVLTSPTVPKCAFLNVDDSVSTTRQTARFSSLRESRQRDTSILPSSNSSTENLWNMFSCLHPVNPHMRNKEARLQTFLDSSSIWPAHRIRATPQQIVDAGMYYLGERDRVKCWYCNGGLQNWERDDNPWEEHAKWFPLCEYVLQQKGPIYVHEIVARFPGLRRPTLYNPSTSQAAQSLVQSLNPGSNAMARSPPQNEIPNQPVIVDPRQEIAERHRWIEEEMRSSDDVAQARMMGFSDDVIKKVLKRQHELSNQGFSTFHELVEAILSVPDQSTDPMQTSNESLGAMISFNSDQQSTLTPIQEIKKLEESRRCKKCFQEDACVVFIPCGHLACCVSCSERIKRCPVCKEVIREKVRSYIS